MDDENKGEHYALVVLSPRAEVTKPGQEIVVASAGCPVIDDPKDPRRLIRAEWRPVRDKEEWMNVMSRQWDAYRDYFTARPPEPEPEPQVDRTRYTREEIHASLDTVLDGLDLP